MMQPVSSAQTIANGQAEAGSMRARVGAVRMRFNADAAAIALAALLVVLVRFHVIPHIGW